ncbi:MAG: TetR/AcrR family transcriptional regulator [Myxococcales bacterium]|nr:TetR/AcrR family transcriptional regulator [Myxococcales bacterium]MCB9702437.1 TetR/AcrR family transcriptional regulator [Myxococcales bacterium]
MTRAPRSDLREAIIRASVELGSRLGEEGLTMRAIAKRLGISATALYQHFESKAAILHEIRIYGADLLQREIVEPVADIDDPLARIKAAADAYIAFARVHPWIYAVLMEHEQINYADMGADEIASFLRPLTAVRTWLREGRERGLIRDDLDPDMSSLRIIATLHGLASMLNSGRFDEEHPAVPIRNQEAFVRDFIDSMICALRK